MGTCKFLSKWGNYNTFLQHVATIIVNFFPNVTFLKILVGGPWEFIIFLQFFLTQIAMDAMDITRDLGTGEVPALYALL